MDILTLKHILIAEDDDFVRRILAAVLTKLGGRVTEAANGMAALTILNHPLPIDIVILDVLMPEAHGLYVLHRIRSGMTRQDFQIPVLLLTATHDEASVHYAAGLSCDGFLLKPLNHAELAERLKKIIAKRMTLPYKPNHYRRIDVGPPDEPPMMPGKRYVNMSVPQLRVGMTFSTPVVSKGRTIVPAGMTVTDTLLTLLRDLEKVALIEPMSVHPPAEVEYEAEEDA